MDADGLTEKQRRFVEAYCGSARGNGTEAARTAGYNGAPEVLAVTASRLLTNAKVSRAIAELNETVRSDAIATAEEVQAFLTGVMRGTEGRQPIVTMAGVATDQDGNVLDTAPEAKDRVKAADTLAKIRGYVAPQKLEHDHKGVQVVRFKLPESKRPKSG